MKVSGRRNDKRFNCRLPMKYEICEDKEKKGITVVTIIHDLSSQGLSFYSHEGVKLDALVKVSFYISSDVELSFLTKVKRIEKSWDDSLGEYLVGVNIEKIEDEANEQLLSFINKFDLSVLFDELDLEGIVDLHFVGNYPLLAKKQDKVIPLDREVLSKEAIRGLLMNLLTDSQYQMFQKEREMNLIFSHKDVRFRVNLHFQQGNIEGIFRVIPPKIKQLRDLGLPSVCETFLNANKGLIIIAGRTGSGKTTTLAAMIDFVNSNREGIILCIEDPTEYVHKNKKCIIKQREVGKDTHSYLNASKSALRQSPDILVIGEIRDFETMDIAISMAESGTLVMTSLHAPNSECALDRIVSLFPPDIQPHVLRRLSLTLVGLITQELIPTMESSGLALASEVLVVNDALRQIIRMGDWKQISTILQTGRAAGMQSREDSIKKLFEQGLIKGEYVKEIYL